MKTAEEITQDARRAGFADLVARDSFFSHASAALGVPVTSFARGDSPRYFVGVIVDTSEDRQSVWVRRYTDDADVSVLYSVRELEPATDKDLAGAARHLLNQQYRETQDLKAKVAREAEYDRRTGIEQYQAEGR